MARRAFYVGIGALSAARPTVVMQYRESDCRSTQPFSTIRAKVCVPAG